MFRRLFRFSLPLALIGALVWLVMSSLDLSRLGAVARTGPDTHHQPVDASLLFTVTLAPVVTSGLVQPVHLTHAGDGSSRLFVVERAGRIRVVKNGTLLAQPFLDISSLVQAGFVEQGLRFSFDRATGDMYIGDVGQDCFEEIDYQPASSHGGENYGWRLMEGLHHSCDIWHNHRTRPVLI